MDDFDDAIIGYTEGYDDYIRVAYDYQKMVEALMTKDKISMEDAVDYIEYNTIRSLPYEGNNAPIVMRTL